MSDMSLWPLQDEEEFQATLKIYKRCSHEGGLLAGLKVGFVCASYRYVYGHKKVPGIPFKTNLMRSAAIGILGFGISYTLLSQVCFALLKYDLQKERKHFESLKRSSELAEKELELTFENHEQIGHPRI